VIVIVALVVALRSTKLVNISFNAVADSWQFGKPTVLAKTIWQRSSEFAPFAKVEENEVSVPNTVVIDAVDNAGID
jgi:hypothetical protein